MSLEFTKELEIMNSSGLNFEELKFPSTPWKVLAPLLSEGGIYFSKCPPYRRHKLDCF